MIAIDTNLLVYAHRASVPEHRSAQRAIERASCSPEGWGFALPALLEFWSVVTHPAAVGGPSSSATARAFVDTLTKQAGAVIWVANPGFWSRLSQLAESLDLCGPRVFDLAIALTAFEGGGTEIWTHDRDFVAVPGMRVVDPL